MRFPKYNITFIFFHGYFYRQSVSTEFQVKLSTHKKFQLCDYHQSQEKKEEGDEDYE